MVDIIIGPSQPSFPISGPQGKKPDAEAVVAELLHIREARYRQAPPSDGERRKGFRRDPLNSRVLTLLIPDRTVLPQDLDPQKYRVALRFIKR